MLWPRKLVPAWYDDDTTAARIFMGFLNSVALWTGLGAAGVAVPVIIHLLYRKHRRQTDWAAMELLRRALVIRSGQVRLEDLIILAMRCLALLLIAAALLRPTLNTDSVTWLGEERVGMVVAIDASYSMNHGEHSRFEKAIKKTGEILASAKQGDPVSLVLMSNRPEILLRRTGYDEAIFNETLNRQKEATSYPLSLEANIDQLEELVAELKTPARECYLVTDAQEHEWAQLSEKAEKSLAKLTRSASVFVVPVTDVGLKNLCITQLEYDFGSLQKGGMARFKVEVRNGGGEAVHGGVVKVFVGPTGQPAEEDTPLEGPAFGKIEAGKTEYVDFNYTFDELGDMRLRVKLIEGSDELADDNECFTVVRVRQGIRVLCVDDLGPGNTAARTGTYYPVRALRLKASEADEGAPIQVNQIAALDLNSPDELGKLDEYDAVLLADVTDLAPETVERLERFVRAGGGLIIFLGDHVDAELYNQRFGSLLPGKLSKVLAAEEGQAGWAIGPVNSGHSLASVIKATRGDVVDAARFSKVMQVEVAPKCETILSIAEQDTPLLLSRSLDAGAVVMFATSADRTWNNFATHPLYTMLLQQAIMTVSNKESRPVIVGESANLALTGRQVGDQVRLVGPDGQDRDVKVTQVGSTMVCAIDADAAGVYGVAGDATIPSVAVAANVDSKESNVRVIDAGALKNQMASTGVKVILDSSALAAEIEKSRQGRELATFLLVAGIVVFLLQSFLAKYFTNRMSHGESNVSASLQLNRVAAARRS
ncbi:MAG: BatA domain-containing protein [Pirellulales bacterium]